LFNFKDKFSLQILWASVSRIGAYMSAESFLDTKITSPLLEVFELRGLNGYKNLTLRLEKNVKIISAENGSGKTTLLNALYAFLTGKVGSLLPIDFSSVLIKFTGSEPITAKKDELFPQLTEEFSERTIDSPSWREALSYGLTEKEFREIVLLRAMDAEDFDSCIGFRKLYEDTPLNREDIQALCDRAIPEALAEGIFAQIHSQIKEAMDGVSVLYLPTFRRIEADLPEFRRRTRMARSRISRDDWDTDRLIFFGLQDVEHRLSTITSDIRKSTFEAYARISARTLDQLLEGDIANSDLAHNVIDVAALNVVLARLGKANSDTAVRITELIESEKINAAEHQSLRSFLGQLLEIHQEKQDLERAVAKFVEVVDSYWDQPGTEKKFHFDKLSVNAEAINTITNKPLPLGSLSSGEKQIISIFARLYLDAKKRYLILIDEPELSLSMEWQQKFLPDVISAPSCVQLIAITHSPFIFDNELDPYAGPLELSYLGKSE
jgi:predicted ATPase